MPCYQHQSALISRGYQCQVVDYDDPDSLQHALMGIDTVISTVTGEPQLRLIEAAVQCRVRRFAPAEFEGQPGLRGQNPVLDRGKTAALSLLEYYQGHIQYTYGSVSDSPEILLTLPVSSSVESFTNGSLSTACCRSIWVPVQGTPMKVTSSLTHAI